MRKVLYIVLLLLCTLPALGQKSASMKKLESQRAQLEKDIALLGQKLDQNAKSSSQALGNLTLLRGKISARL